MIEYRPTIGAEGPMLKTIAPAFNPKEIFINERDPEVRKSKLLDVLKIRLNEINPTITTAQMVCSIQETLELSDDELRRIIPEGSSQEHTTDSFVGLWYLSSIYKDTFAQDMRSKHKEHTSYDTTEPVSHLELLFERGIGPVLMEHYEIFKPTEDEYKIAKSTIEPVPLSPAQ